MSKYKFKPDAAEVIGKTGIPQAEIARRANVDASNMNRRINERTPIRITTVARIAEAFAELRKISQDEAISLLFEKID